MISLLPTLFKPSSTTSVDLFDEFFNRTSPWNLQASNHTNWPAIDVAETEQSVKVTVEVPGVKLEDLELTYQEGLLMVRGEKHHQSKNESEHLFYQESSYGKFSRLITLDTDLNWELVEANFEEGVLSVTIPKNETPENKTKTIKIS